MLIRAASLVAGTLLLPAAALAQEPEPIVTDRPDQTESAQIVPAAVVQVELGWTYDRASDGPSDLATHTVPGILVRLGLGSHLEGRLAFGGWQATGTRGVPGTSTSRGDIEPGFKYQIRAPSGSGPRVAFLGAVSLPTGSGTATTSRADPSVLLALAHQLSDRYALSYNVGAAAASGSTGTGNQTLVDVIGSVSLGVAVTPVVGAFIETFGALGASSAGENAVAFDGGLTYLVGNNLQLDLSVGIGLGAAAEWFVGSGVAVRLPR